MKSSKIISIGNKGWLPTIKQLNLDTYISSGK